MTAIRFREFLRTAAALAVLLVWSAPGRELAGQKRPAATPPAALVPGEFVWMPELAPSGPVVLLVSISEQRLYAYRNGVRIGYTTVSTGKPGHETPTGVFTVLEKDRDHVSSLYKGAKMPNMERLTWSGIALHAGALPGYPASHGCVRMPLEFSRLLFELDPIGTTVVIADDHDGPHEAAHPGWILAPDLGTGSGSAAASGAASFTWAPERSPRGPVTVLLSAAERSAFVYRNGIEIGRAELRFRGATTQLSQGVFTVLEGSGEHRSPFAPERPDHRWMGVPLGHVPPDEAIEKAALLAQVEIPQEFGAAVYDVLAPGTTIYVTNHEVAPHTTSASDFVVLATHDGQVTG